MGRQVNCYMLPADAVEFLKAIGNMERVYFMNSRQTTFDLQPIPVSTIREIGTLSIFGYLARAADLPSIRLQFVPAQGYWTIDDAQSPVVQFNRGFYDGTILRRGRLYFQPWYYDNSDWATRIDKSPAFVRWAENLLRWVRRHYQRDPETGFYIGPHARAWAAQGAGRLLP